MPHAPKTDFLLRGAAPSGQSWLELAGGAQVVRVVAWATLIGALIYIALLPNLRSATDLRLFGPTFLIPIALITLLLVRAGRTVLACHALIWGVWLGVTLAAVAVAGIRTDIVFIYPALVVAAMALGPRSVLSAGILSILAVIGLASAELAGWLPPPVLPETFVLSLSYALVLFVTACLALGMVHEQKRLRTQESHALAALQDNMAALRQREQDLHSIMSSVPAGICAFDGWTCRFANQHLAVYCGQTEESIVGRHLGELLGRIEYRLAQPYVEKVLQGEVVHYRGPNPSPLARGQFMQFSLVPRQDAAGRNSGFYGIFFDTTRQERAKQEIERLNRELEQRVRERTSALASANRELEAFAYSISHDLRTPLRGIDGFSQMALEEYGAQLQAQGRSYLERVRAAAQRMGQLIDDILELSRVARQSMRWESVPLSRMVHELLEELRANAPERTVRCSIAPNLQTRGDSRLLRILLQNLLENAWKYTQSQGAAHIEFGCETGVAGEMVFFVRDNGVGFDMKYAERLFTPFQRMHGPKDYPGSGVGLATVSRIVHRHGGRVWAESMPGLGTTLRFTLGRARPGNVLRSPPRSRQKNERKAPLT